MRDALAAADALLARADKALLQARKQYTSRRRSMYTDTPVVLTHRYINPTGVLMHRYAAAVCCWLQARTGLVAMPGGKVSKVEQAARHVAQASAVLEAARYSLYLLY